MFSLLNVSNDASGRPEEFGPKDQRNKMDKFISVFEVMTPKKCPKEMILRQW